MSEKCKHDTAEQIDADAFAEYMANDFTLSDARRDHYYARALCALREREKQLEALGIPLIETECPS